MKYHLFWISSDRQSSIPMGEYDTREDAEASIPKALTEMKGECGEKQQEREIEAGTFEIEGREV